MGSAGTGSAGGRPAGGEGHVDLLQDGEPVTEDRLDAPQHGCPRHPLRMGAVHDLDVQRVVPVLGGLVDVDGQALGATAQPSIPDT